MRFQLIVKEKVDPPRHSWESQWRFRISSEKITDSFHSSLSAIAQLFRRAVLGMGRRTCKLVGSRAMSAQRHTDRETHTERERETAR